MPKINTAKQAAKLRTLRRQNRMLVYELRNIEQDIETWAEWPVMNSVLISLMRSRFQSINLLLNSLESIGSK